MGGMYGKLKKALGLYKYFFRIGWYTFGGGWSIVAQMQKDFVEERKEITSQELLDMVSVGKSLPGLMIGNVTYLFGYHQGGVLGGIFCVLGISTPPLIILSILTVGYVAARDNIWVERMLSGVRCVVAPIILSAAVNLRKGAFPHAVCYGLGALAFIAAAVFRANNVAVILFGVAAGLLFGAVGKGEGGSC